MKTGKRHTEYVQSLLEKTKNEVKKRHPIHEAGDQFTSPPSATSLEENRILMDYIEQVNLRKLAEARPEQKKPLFLKKFFKMKRNQQVDVYVLDGEAASKKAGKVIAIGRDFVVLSTLTNRLWIPYHSIEAAKIPEGVPNYSDSHQYFIYDNNLRKKLLENFGETISSREALKQQFFEETLRTNLLSWKGSMVNVHLKEGGNSVGRLESATTHLVVLKVFFKQLHVTQDQILYISSIRLFRGLLLQFKKFLNSCYLWGPKNQKRNNL
ncbi:hypothetical protein A8F94_01090 [Bacillus sp. FJAT-27225]|uniref:hypothetical protein n=1 Tax=Bacillus sp. FJAT-27225 TaxID=1743144 RepID=UPI00080C308A|nr:hypothetical protein [Bacillus sp. FJAT-27225]OCA90512.1 hypothetical protein A8F94_01090 [Bacillus sp. FJAT-27225]